MAAGTPNKVKTAHVNMMTDSIITNLSADGLRVVLLSLLASHPEITGSFESGTRRFITDSILPNITDKSAKHSLNGLKTLQRNIRCMFGCGLVKESLQPLNELVIGAFELQGSLALGQEHEVQSFLASVDGDVVQAMTAVQKALFIKDGVRGLRTDEDDTLRGLYQTLLGCHATSLKKSAPYPYGRGLDATASLLGLARPSSPGPEAMELFKGSTPRPARLSETFNLNGRELPRIFSGLWQMSSPAWGSAPMFKIMDQLSNHVQAGLTAFDMADHYGDAEIIFGRFHKAYAHKDAVFAATKYCVFHPVEITREAVQASISERCQRLQTEKLSLLQFHWQFYENKQYLDAVRYITEDDRVGALGLCNFDTEHMKAVLDTGVKIYTNQVQFSLIDSRPMIKMGKLCEQHDVKLLTYGTLCGGFIADKWLGQPEPNLYHESVTPGQRKYFGVIRTWGGWSLFQELLRSLKSIGDKHGVSISTVATRWVLDFPYVGAVILGARLGISEHTRDNLATLGWHLSSADRDAIEKVLEKSSRSQIFDTMGDSGGEYR
ncbi:hypothetical protein QQS21_001453 [Conoideocrella luteorostrata]|uniref:NADP-dependent oxidoreductase domain-containing protein n=1 Tax=Conoideocrella luteorostrata TaxID=1105319 RepID=A0AAJ0CZT6_9HYPO|nr:hypothetical protein QQS21_001453 [Conoideocrella luteorostrata]